MTPNWVADKPHASAKTCAPLIKKRHRQVMHKFLRSITSPSRLKLSLPAANANRGRLLSDSHRSPPDVHMNDAEAEVISHQLAPASSAPALNLANVASDASSVLGGTAGSAVGSISPDPPPNS